MYKILVTTVATRSEGISVKTDVLEFDSFIDACSALARLNDERSNYSIGFAQVNRKAIAINFSDGE